MKKSQREKKAIVFMEVSMLVGFFFLYENSIRPATHVQSLVFGLLFAGTGIFCNVTMLIEKCAPQKNIPVLLVSIKSGGEYTGFVGEALYVLKFQDRNGKYYFSTANDITNLKEYTTYALTVKGKKVLNVGSQSSFQLNPRNIEAGYWSGFYPPSKTPIKIELPGLLFMLWVILFFFVFSITEGSSIRGLAAASGFSWFLAKDYLTKRDERNMG